MKKLKIERKFTDKYTGKAYKVGAKVDFEDDRAEELLADSRGLVSEVAEASKKAAKKSTKK